jgi:hypothetical protein
LEKALVCHLSHGRQKCILRADVDILKGFFGELPFNLLYLVNGNIARIKI